MSASEESKTGLDPDEAQRIMRHDPRRYMHWNWSHPDDARRSYDFYNSEGDKPLYYLTDDHSPLNPQTWGDINVLLFARGCLKTTSCVGVLNWALDEYPNIEALNTAPRDDQKSEVVDRFKEKAEQSGLTDRRVKNNIEHQKFKTLLEDEDGDTETVYGHLKSRSAWGGGDALRGIHAHVGVIDEFQDVEEGTFSVFLEAIDRSVPGVPYFPVIFIIGTPKMQDSFFHELWKMSDQKTWRAETVETEEGEKRTGKWVQQARPDTYGEGGDTYTVRGWHIDQHNSPLHSDAKIELKKDKYSKRKFANEVLAEFYSPEDDLITSDDVIENFWEENGWESSRVYDESTVAVGVDWGGGSRDDAAKTAITVLEKHPDVNGYVVLNHIFADPSLTPQDEIELVEEQLGDYEADVAVLDYGHGNKQLKDLQDGNGTFYGNEYIDVVKGCQYGNIKNKYELKWEKDTGKKRFFTCDRSYMMESFVEDFKESDFWIPKKDLDFDSKRDDGTMLVDHLTAPYKEADETRSGRKKLRITADRNDDAFHSFTYAWIGINEVRSTRTVRKIISRDRRGY